MKRIKLFRFNVMIIVAFILHTAVIPASTYAIDESDTQLNNYTEGPDLVIEGELGEGESDPASQPNDHRPADDIPALTADEEADPVSDSYKSAVPCKQVFLGKVANSPIVSDDATVDDCPLPPDPQGGPNQDPGRTPTTRDLLYLATAVVHADGAGLYKRPFGVSYTNKFIPTIVAATRPTQSHVVTMFGREITVTFTATNYEWNWGDGTQNLVTTSNTTHPHKGGAPGSTARTLTRTAKSHSRRRGVEHSRTLSPGKHRRSTAWSPPPKQRASFRCLTWLSTTLTPGKKNKDTRPETTREVDAP